MPPISTRIQEARRRLDIIQFEWATSTPRIITVVAKRETMNQLQKFLIVEESMMKGSKDKSLHLGDSNTKYLLFSNAVQQEVIDGKSQLAYGMGKLEAEPSLVCWPHSVASYTSI
eukprot:TRINITY_DN5357_c0_g2_i1.p1 TRINITY_DN5357_c0_g2~~TRINITY_DN5357_c0_g2_i1.p1  ORF type:complete len:115 (-),score=14.89 TRINITY_DN5357_c0_g2_i1:613-957(-)